MAKRCIRCNVPKELDEFPVRKDAPDGHRGTCNECWNHLKRNRSNGIAAEPLPPVEPCTLCGRRRKSPDCPVCMSGDTTLPKVQAFGLTDVEIDMSDLDADAIDPLTPSLVSFGTPMQRMSAEALLRLGSIEAAATELQLQPAQLRAHLDELQRRAATRGYAPANSMTRTAPSGFSVKGVSSYFKTDKKTGESTLVGQWVKTNRDQDEKLQMLLDAMGTLAHQWQGLAEPVAPPAIADDDLLACYVMGDPHLGMFSWGAETGNNFDIAIAERELYAAADHLVALTPPAKRALIVSVGDFFHADNRASTTTGGTPVDSDGRWPKVLSAGIRLTRRLIDRALTKHDEVGVILEIGNHDWHTSIMLAIAIAQYYENEPRVTVDTSPAKYHWYRFGQNLIGVTHGDTVKLADLGGVMACDRPVDWGETKYRYWLTGHIHHDTVKELRGCIVESFRTLAPADAWHKGQGYRSGRDMKALIFHREWGQINRHVVGINQIQQILEGK